MKNPSIFVKSAFVLALLSGVISCGEASSSSAQPSGDPSSSQPGSEPASQPSSEASQSQSASSAASTGGDATEEGRYGQTLYSDGIEIGVVTSNYELPTLVALVNQYNLDHPSHINIDIEIANYIDRGQTLMEVLQKDSRPALLSIGDYLLPYAVERKALAPLNKSMQQEIRESQSQAAIDSVEYNNAIVAFPYTVDNGYFLYYDGDYATEEQASSLEGLLEIASKDHQVLFDISNGWYLNSIFMAEGVCGKTSIQWKKNTDGDVVYDIAWDSEKGVEAASYLASILAPAYGSRAFMLDSGDTLEIGFKVKTAFAAVCGTWEYEILKGLCPNLKARRLPTFTDKNGTHQMGSFAGSKVYIASAFAPEKEKEAALLLGEYLTTKESQLKRLADQDVPPSDKEAVATETFIEKASIATKALNNQSQFAAIQTKRVEDRYWDVGAKIGKAIAKNDPGESGWAEFLKQQCDVLRAPAKK